MHIKVNDILTGEVGHRTAFSITDEVLSLSELELVDTLSGDIQVAKLRTSLVVSGQAYVTVKLECHRCLRAFESSQKLKLNGEFSAAPIEEQWPIAKELTIDLAPMIEQEILLMLPIKQLCSPDCLGLCVECGLLNSSDHIHSNETKLKSKE